MFEEYTAFSYAYMTGKDTPILSFLQYSSLFRLLLP